MKNLNQTITEAKDMMYSCQIGSCMNEHECVPINLTITVSRTDAPYFEDFVNKVKDEIFINVQGINNNFIFTAFDD